MKLVQMQWLVISLAATISVIISLASIPLARRMGLIDYPGQRKVHDTETVLTGGLAIYVVMLTGGLVLDWDSEFFKALAVGGSLMFLMGLFDDRRHISPLVRFIVQIVACLIMIYWGGVRLDDFGRLFTDDVLEVGPLGAMITVFAAMGVINSFNMVDGMDGLAGTLFLLSTLCMALFAGNAGLASMHGFLLFAASAVFGFLLLNARFPWNQHARVFLGDSGSMLLGFILAWCFIALGNDHNEAGRRAFIPMTAVWIFAVPLLDTSTQIWRRWKAGQSALVADQYHLHHAFLRAGFSVGQTWIAISVFAIFLAVVGILLDITAVPEYLSFWLFVSVAFGFYFYIRRSWRIQRFLGRDFIYNDFDKPESTTFD